MSAHPIVHLLVFGLVDDAVHHGRLELQDEALSYIQLFGHVRKLFPEGCKTILWQQLLQAPSSTEMEHPSKQGGSSGQLGRQYDSGSNGGGGDAVVAAVAAAQHVDNSSKATPPRFELYAR